MTVLMTPSAAISDLGGHPPSAAIRHRRPCPTSTVMSDLGGHIDIADQ
jgi:hypothetical protein